MPVLNQNWVNVNAPPKRALMAQQTAGTAGVGLPPGFTGGSNGPTRQVQSNELASTHMEELGRGDNRILQQARQRGVMAGASRGGINSNLAAAGGEQAWLDAAGNVAMQQAGAYGTAAGQNLESIGRQQIAREGNETSLGVAGIGAGASMYASDNQLLSAREGRLQDRDLTLSGRDFQRSEREGGQNWQSGEREGEQNWRSGESERDRNFDRDMQERGWNFQQEGQDNELDRQMAADIFRSMLDNPEEWDEYMATGAVDFFARYLNPRRRAVVPGQTTQPVPDGP